MRQNATSGLEQGMLFAFPIAHNMAIILTALDNYQTVARITALVILEAYSRWKMNLTKTDHGTNTLVMLICIETYLVPFLVSVGIFGSIFTTIVLTRTSLKKKFLSHFLVGTSVSSIGFLSTLMVTWLYTQGVPVYMLTGLCQMNIFCSHFFPFLSFWLSAVSAVLILFDLKRAKSLKWMNSPTASKSWVIGLSILSFTLFSYKTWTYSSVKSSSRDVCTVIRENEQAMEIMSIVDLLLILCLPSLTFLTFDLYLLFRVIVTQGKDKVYRRRHKEVLKIIVCYCILFHLLVSPRAISTILVTINKSVYNQMISKQELIVDKVVQLLFYLYFAISPIIPFCVSAKFRRNLQTLWSHGCTDNFALRPLRPVSPTF